MVRMVRIFTYTRFALSVVVRGYPWLSVGSVGSVSHCFWALFAALPHYEKQAIFSDPSYFLPLRSRIAE
jgi:hypothetical protein